MSPSGIRALTRVARRDITRNRGRSLLVALLILLPVAAMVGAISIHRTTQPTQDQTDVAQMGRADLLAVGLSETELRTHLPAGSRVEPIAWEDGQLVLPGVKPSVSIRAMDLSGLAQGMLTLTEGRLPSGVGEVAISSFVAKLAGTTLGGQVTLDGLPTATVVGFVENPAYLSDRVVLLDPGPGLVGTPEFGTWLIGLPEGADPQAIVDSRIDPTTGNPNGNIQSRESGGLDALGGDASPSIMVLGTLALVEAALIASAAFAVGIRRRQRELGLLAAVGASPRQLAGTVVAEAAILGLIASVVGVAVGLVGPLALTPFLDQLTERRNGPLVVDGLGLAGPAMIGFAAAMIAAIVPARTAANVPVLMSLSGRRPPVAPARRTLRLGLAMVAFSVGMTVAGANLQRDSSDSIGLLLMIGGAVLGTLASGRAARGCSSASKGWQPACPWPAGSPSATRHARDHAAARSSPRFSQRSPQRSRSGRSP